MIAYHQLLSVMMRDVPQLRLPFQRLKEEWRNGETPGPHIVLEDAVVPFLDELLARGQFETVDRMLAFAEKALGEGDEDVFAAIGQSFIEPIEVRPLLRQYVKPRAGPNVRALMR